MALMLNEEFNFKSVKEAFEKAGMFFYRLDKMANTAIVISSHKYGDFKDPLYREECVYYQLEAIRDLAKQFETLFCDAAMTLGRRADDWRKDAERGQPGSGELLPENAAQAVLATGASRTRPPLEPADLANDGETVGDGESPASMAFYRLKGVIMGVKQTHASERFKDPQRKQDAVTRLLNDAIQMAQAYEEAFAGGRLTPAEKPGTAQPKAPPQA